MSFDNSSDAESGRGRAWVRVGATMPEVVTTFSVLDALAERRSRQRSQNVPLGRKKGRPHLNSTTGTVFLQVKSWLLVRGK